jgi:hypothetical protein
MDDMEVEMEVPPSQADAGFAHLARMLQPAKVYGNQKLSETRKVGGGTHGGAPCWLHKHCMCACSRVVCAPDPAPGLQACSTGTSPHTASC